MGTHARRDSGGLEQPPKPVAVINGIEDERYYDDRDIEPLIPQPTQEQIEEAEYAWRRRHS